MKEIKAGGDRMKKDERESGHMTNDMNDVVELGKQMEKMRDEQELNRDGYIQDPVQYEKELQPKKKKNKMEKPEG